MASSPPAPTASASFGLEGSPTALNSRLPISRAATNRPVRPAETQLKTWSAYRSWVMSPMTYTARSGPASAMLVSQAARLRRRITSIRKIASAAETRPPVARYGVKNAPTW